MLSDLKIISDIVDRFGTPLLAVLTWLVWRIKANDLPHIYESMKMVGERLARLEGRQEERDSHDNARMGG